MTKKSKTCKHCGEKLPIEKFASKGSKYCLSCKMAMLKETTDKKLEIKNTLKLSEYKKVVQKKVNAFVRERDKNLPCISCGKRTKLEAGHYVAQGSSGFLRYNLDNLNGQCRACNRWKSGNLIEYRIGLIKKIGEDKVKWLEENRRVIHQWTREELQDVEESV